MVMAKLLSLVSIYSLATSLLLNNIIGNSNGLTLELIHPNSQESSSLETNFSNEERIQRLVRRSILRTNYLISSLSKTVSMSTTLKQEFLEILPRPPTDLQEFNYIVKIGIGTFKSRPTFIEYYLDMDTGSSITWIQCEGCTKCFKQKPTPFPSNKSTTFHPISDGDNKPLRYKIEYQDGSYSSGICAKETIHLSSNIKHRMKRVPRFVFGCGLVNNVEYGEYKKNRIAGVMGLGWGTYSFVNQIKESKGRFSYCLPLVSSSTKIRPKTYLRFGDDIIEGQKAISTTMTKVEGVGTYYVELQGISINNKRLNISKHVFDRSSRHKGGCIIDSATPYSRIIEPAYIKLKEGLEEYFSRNKNLQRATADLGLDFCYYRRKPEGFENLPEITLHFEGSMSGLLIRPEGGFEVGKRLKSFKFREYFCLAMIPSRRNSIIGAHQQTNQRIIYDTQNKKLVFHPEDCSKNS